jgi:ATP-binding cassette subfamily B protein/subfamily B ATP-binding cassette protein MsbA
MRSSRSRYDHYQQQLLEARGKTGKYGPDGRIRGRRHRPFHLLLGRLWGLLRGHRLTLMVALITLSVATLLKLVPIYGTKIVLDNVLAGHPLPATVPTWVRLPTDRYALLKTVAVGMITLSVVSILIGTWSRWQATRITKRVQMTLRRRVFDHAARLPLNRVWDLKSGGVASMLREDAGGVADLIFSML